MGKGNGRRFVLDSGSAQFFECPRLVTTGSVSIEHLLEQRLYSKKNKKCQECGVCAAFKLKVKLKAKAPVSDAVPIAGAREKVRPHGWNATHKRTVWRVSSGLGG